jgi:hypothetical protein
MVGAVTGCNTTMVGVLIGCPESFVLSLVP